MGDARNPGLGEHVAHAPLCDPNRRRRGPGGRM